MLDFHSMRKNNWKDKFSHVTATEANPSFR